MVIQILGKNSNSVSKFLPLFIFRHHFKQDNDQINLHECFENEQLDIFYYIFENSYKKIIEASIYILHICRYMY